MSFIRIRINVETYIKNRKMMTVDLDLGAIDDKNKNKEDHKTKKEFYIKHVPKTFPLEILAFSKYLLVT